MIEREALKPCPLCGGEAIPVTVTLQTKVVVQRIRCRGCQCQVERLTRGEAVAIWNRRPATPTPVAAGEGMVFVPRRFVDQALDALDSIAGDRTPKFFPETSYDCAKREAAELRAILANGDLLSGTWPDQGGEEIARLRAGVRAAFIAGVTHVRRNWSPENDREYTAGLSELADDYVRAALTNGGDNA